MKSIIMHKIVNQLFDDECQAVGFELDNTDVIYQYSNRWIGDYGTYIPLISNNGAILCGFVRKIL